MGLDVLPGAGVNKSQDAGMQTLSLRCKRGLALSGIYFIAHERVMDIGHMDADLMGPAGLQPAFHICILPESAKNLSVGNSALAVRPDRHSLAVF